jgi:hypothetical protein
MEASEGNKTRGVGPNRLSALKYYQELFGPGMKSTMSLTHVRWKQKCYFFPGKYTEVYLNTGRRASMNC